MKNLNYILLILLLIIGLGTLYFMFKSRADFSTIIKSLNETKTQIEKAQRINTEAIKSLSALQSEIKAYEEDINKLREARDSGLLTIKRGNENALEKLRNPYQKRLIQPFFYFFLFFFSRVEQFFHKYKVNQILSLSLDHFLLQVL